MARPGISTKNTEKIPNPKKIPQKYRKNTKNTHFQYFRGIFSVFSGYFGGKFWECRISGRGGFFRYFSLQFRVGPFRGSVTGRGVLNSRLAQGIPLKNAQALTLGGVGNLVGPLCGLSGLVLVQKNPRAHENKIGTPPPPPNPKYPPLRRGILWTWRFSCRKNAFFPGVHKIGAAVSGPRIADTKIQWKTAP